MLSSVEHENSFITSVLELTKVVITGQNRLVI